MEKKLKNMGHFTRSISEVTAYRCGKRIRYNLSYPLDIHFYEKGNLFIAENSEFAVVGTGKSAGLAVNSLIKHMVHFYYYFKKLPASKITGDAIRLKERYKVLVSKMERLTMPCKNARGDL